MMKWLQKLGKALMLPVAALPVCGILMGIGYALAPAVMGAEGPTTGAAYTVGFLLVKAGGALIDNMAWLFAIGAAVGLADDHDGTAGLAGLVSFLMMQQLLSPGVVGTIRAAVGSTLEEGTVDYIAFSKIAGNSFIGILAAVIGATCYNKFKSTKLPDWLAFFSGKRSVAIMTALVSIVVSVILLFVWPVIFGILVALGNGIAGLSGIGAGIYAFLNRLLIPTGLHHALNNVFWFDTIDTVELCLPVFTAMIDTLTVNRANMRRAANGGFISATDCADYLAKKGMPFREAYGIVGKLVGHCMDTGHSLETLPLEEYQKVSPYFQTDVYDALSLETCVEGRKVYGGPAPEAVKVQMEHLKQFIQEREA